MDIGYDFNWKAILDYGPQIWSGILYTILSSLVGIVGALVVGLGCGAVLAYRFPIAKQIVSGYVAFFRYTPILVQIFFIYYALPSVGIKLGVFQVVAIALILWGGAYNAENFRAAFEAVSPGFKQSSAALGMSQLQTFQHVVFPIAGRIVIPSAINTSISILKDTAYLSAIGFAELTYVATNIVANDFRVFEMFSILGLVYLGLVLMLSLSANRVHERLKARGTVAN